MPTGKPVSQRALFSFSRASTHAASAPSISEDVRVFQNEISLVAADFERGNSKCARPLAISAFPTSRPFPVPAAWLRAERTLNRSGRPGEVSQTCKAPVVIVREPPMRGPIAMKPDHQRQRARRKLDKERIVEPCQGS